MHVLGDQKGYVLGRDTSTLLWISSDLFKKHTHQEQDNVVMTDCAHEVNFLLEDLRTG